MTRLPILNGFIDIHFVKKLYSLGKYERRFYLSVQNDREFCDLRLSREQTEELIKILNDCLKENP